MYGQMSKYKESLQNTPECILLKDCRQIKMDLSGMIKFAKSKGVQPVDLTEEEKRMFIKK